MLRSDLFISESAALPVVLLLALSAILIIPLAGGAQNLPGDITILEGGNIWIEGSAGPVDFSCHAEKLSGKGQIETPENPRATVTEDGNINISVGLPVKSLNCGKQAMNRDMYGALKAEEHPTISYQLLEASLASESSDTLSDGEWMSIRTRGIMEIAGVQDTTSVFVQGRIIDNNQFQVKGSKNIHMDTYNIDPPSKMFGLIRTSKELTVHFDVTVSLTDTLN